MTGPEPSAPDDRADEIVALPDWPALDLDVRMAAVRAAQESLVAQGFEPLVLHVEEALYQAWKALQAEHSGRQLQQQEGPS